MSKEPHAKEAPLDPEVLRLLKNEPQVSNLGALAGHVCDLTFVPSRYTGKFHPMNGISTLAFVANFLAAHFEQAVKDENGIIPGRCEKYKTVAAVKSIALLVYDIDRDLSLAQVRRVLAQFKKCAVLATSFNHEKSLTKLKDVRGVNGARVNPSIGPLTNADAAAYCANHKKFCHLRNVRVAQQGRLLTDNGEPYFLVEHDPIDKCRVYVFLSVPINIIEVGHVVYKAVYHALGQQLFDNAYDRACAHANRIFYLPAKLIGSTVEHVIEHFDFELFDWRQLGSQIAEQVAAQQAEAAARLKQFGGEARSVELAEIADALKHIAPEEYDTWFVALAAIHNETKGSEEGRMLAHEWSALSPEQYDPDAVDSRWDAFSDTEYVGRKATFGTLVYLARKTNPDFRVSSRLEAIADDLINYD